MFRTDCITKDSLTILLFFPLVVCERLEQFCVLRTGWLCNLEGMYLD